MSKSGRNHSAREKASIIKRHLLDNYYMCSVLDGFSRFIVHWEIRESMKEKDVEHYNNKRLHSAIAYVTPKDMLEGKQKKILKERDQKLENARMKRKEKRNCMRPGGL